MIPFVSMWFQGMRTVAERTGWKLTPPDPGLVDMYSFVTLTGEREGFLLRLDRTGATHVFSTTAFFLSPLPITFAVRHQGLGGTIANLVGFHDVEIGDPEFDRSFRLISKDPAWITRLMTTEVKAALVKLSTATASFGSGFQIWEHGVSVNRTYMLAMSPDEVMADVPLVLEVARALQSAAAAASG